MIKITYPGTGNFSTFGYDGLSRNVSIVETTAGSVTSTKQFVWSRTVREEERDGVGTLTRKFFALAQTVGAGVYYYEFDHLLSVVGMTDSMGNKVAEYLYDPYGRISKVLDTVSPDFGYAHYYTHARSNLKLTLTRGYNSNLGRFLSRDSIEERGGTNMYAYVGSSPTNLSDKNGTTLPHSLYLVDDILRDLWSTGGYGMGAAGIFAGRANAAVAQQGLTGDAANAYRHCVWSCLMAQNLGPSLAQTIADNHELAGQDVGQSDRDTAIDQCNNAAGRCAAHDPQKNCTDKCLELLHAGSLCGPNGVPQKM